MAWRVPRYSYRHALRTIGVSGITVSPAADASFPVYNLIDDRASSFFKFGSSSSAAVIDGDLGATPPVVDRVVIPAGHNLSGATITVSEDDNAGFTSPNALGTSGTLTSALVDLSFTASSERYVRVAVNGTGTWELPQLYLTQTNTTTRGPEQRWADTLTDNVVQFALRSGSVASLELGPDRRTFEYAYRALDATDEAIFAALWSECKTARPFLLDPAYDSEAALFVKLAAPIDRQNDREVPNAAAAPRWQRRLTMIEHVA